MRVYVACLASYNNGVLHGRWIEATADVDEMMGEVRAMLAESPVPDAEEWAIHDTEGLPSTIGEFSGLEPVAAFVELVGEYGWLNEDDIAEIVSDFGGVEEARDRLKDGFCGVYDSFQDYSDEHADEIIGTHASHDHFNLMAAYFDYDAFARDLRMNMHVIELRGGRVAIFHT